LFKTGWELLEILESQIKSIQNAKCRDFNVVGVRSAASGFGAFSETSASYLKTSSRTALFIVTVH